jgi:hypothetical protein
MIFRRRERCGKWKAPPSEGGRYKREEPYVQNRSFDAQGKHMGPGMAKAMPLHKTWLLRGGAAAFYFFEIVAGEIVAGIESQGAL